MVDVRQVPGKLITNPEPSILDDTERKSLLIELSRNV